MGFFKKKTVIKTYDKENKQRQIGFQIDGIRMDCPVDAGDDGLLPFLELALMDVYGQDVYKRQIFGSTLEGSKEINGIKVEYYKYKEITYAIWEQSGFTVSYVYTNDGDTDVEALIRQYK